MDPKTINTLAKLLAMVGSSNEGESANAKQKIDEILRKHKRSWAELRDILGSSAPDPQPRPQPPPGVDPDGDDRYGPLHVIIHILRQYLEMQEQEYLAVALWVMHTHVFDRFMITPRLAIVSPVRECGKTTLLDILNVLCAKAKKTDGITPAAVFRLIDSERPTLLCDEVDNYDLASDGIFRAVLNSGHRHGGSFIRVIDGAARGYSTFSPVALAVIGTLPLPLIQRSVVIRMTRADGSRPLKRFDKFSRLDVANLETIYAFVFRWALHPKVNTDPRMPTGVRNRAADNWRPLVAIADACGENWGAAARQAAV
jgi:Protein of unknown function (DUF3631)